MRTHWGPRSQPHPRGGASRRWAGLRRARRARSPETWEPESVSSRRSLRTVNLVSSMYFPTCRREKRAVPGCSTREPQRWHSTAFRFRPSADTSSFCSSAGSIAAPPQHGPPRRTRGLGALTRNYAGAAPQGRGARRPSLDLCAGVWTLLRRRLYFFAGPKCQRDFVTNPFSVYPPGHRASLNSGLGKSLWLPYHLVLGHFHCLDNPAQTTPQQHLATRHSLPM